MRLHKAYIGELRVRPSRRLPPLAGIALAAIGLLSHACGLATNGYEADATSRGAGSAHGGGPSSTGALTGGTGGTGGQGGDAGMGGHGGGDPCEGVQPTWSLGAGDSKGAQGVNLAVDADRNVVVVGYFDDKIKLGDKTLTSAGMTDIFLAKLDSTGNVLWSKSFGDAGNQQPESAVGSALSVVINPSGEIFLVGTFQGTINLGGAPLSSAGTDDVVVAKFGPDGDHLWSKRFGDAEGQSARTAALDSTGALRIAGRFNGTIDFGGDPVTATGSPEFPYAIFVVKIGSSAEYHWSKSFASASPVAAALDSDDAMLITGLYSGNSPPDFGGGQLPAINSNDYETFVLKLDTNGMHVWSKGVGGADYRFVYGIAAGPAGDPILTGAFRGQLDLGGAPPVVAAGGTDAFVARLNAANGAAIWAFSGGDVFDQQSADVSVDKAGDILLTGSFVGNIDFHCGTPVSAAAGLDAFVIKLAPNGACIVQKGFGLTGDQIPAALATDACGNVLLTGTFDGTIDFGQKVLKAEKKDAFIAKLSL